jgi:hypothetical protein
MQNSDALRRESAESHSAAVMPRFKRGIQYAVTSRMGTNRLWNTGSPGQAGRRRRSKMPEHAV